MKLILKILFPFTFLFTLGNSFYAQENSALLQAAINDKAEQYNLTSSDTKEWKVTDSHKDRKSGISFYYLTQTYDDLFVHNAISVIAIKDQNATLTTNKFIPELAQKIETTTATISPKEAILLGAKSLGLDASKGIEQRKKINKNHYLFDAEGLSKEEINVRLKLFQLKNESVRAVWDLDIYQINQKHWWHLQIDAQTGELLNQIDWVDHCDVNPVKHTPAGNHSKKENLLNPGASLQGAGYRVFAIPVESPNHGARTLEIDPENLNASPYGWHDTDGVMGPESTSTFGNNVYASEDRADNNNVGYAPDGGSTLNFDFPLDFNQHPVDNEDAVITNLFYMNNIMHDVWYEYGFDEASGNFQKNNYGNGGLADDHVYAQAQDGGGMNNANFATPPDGYSPTMQMYLWTAATPNVLTVNSPSPVSGSYGSETAGFGPSIPTTPLTADVVLYEDNSANPTEACQSAINGAALNGKIALIHRGNCNFTDKVANAEAEGAIAVIVINNVAGNPITMGGTDPGIGIPSVMISMADGADLIAEIQNNSVVNATLQMSSSSFPIDGDFDNGIIAHEYGHGISNRLTGGAGNSSCLSNAEQMGEGWSDWFGLMLTIEPGDQGEDSRGYGTYAAGELPSGGGIRPLPYSTDFNINYITYDYTNNTSTISEPHGIGFVWASMLWDLTWALVDKHGMDSDVYNGTGGNNIAMHLVMNGLKLQGCNPGFIDGRDAILEADQLLYNGENTCLIWEVFAERGLGYSADQGSSSSRTDQTEAFDLPPYVGSTSSSETVVTCEEFTWPTNNQTYTESGEYTEYLLNSNGCDSIVTLNLTIEEPETYSTSKEACESYTWSANGQTYSNSGVYIETLSSIHGCDSTVTLNLTINNPESSEITKEACDSYTWPVNNQTYSTSGVYTETLSSVYGCDSVVTLNLTISTPEPSSITKEACGSYTWPANNQAYFTSGVYTETLITNSGCDSIVTLNLTVNNEPISTSITEEVCGSYTWTANGQTYTNSGVYTEILSTSGGCDSTITLNLTINNQPLSSSITEEVCDSYIWPANGQSYTTSGVYTETLNTISGCDSIATLNLTVNNIDAQVTIDLDESALIASPNYSTYQWVNCNKDFAPIPGEDNATFVPSNNGNFAVIINDGNCSDTSSCITVNKAGLEDETMNDINIYPNPTSGIVNIDFMNTAEKSTLKVFDMTGKLVQEFTLNNQKKFQFLLRGESGIYTLEIENDSGIVQRKRVSKLD